MDHRVLRDPYANRAAPGMLEPPRDFARRRQPERVASGNPLLHNAELPVVELRVTADLAQIAANQRQMMPVVDRTQSADALHGIRVADLASECIARIRRICDHPARADDFSRLSHQSRLRIGGMDGKILSHEFRKARRASRRSRQSQRVSLYNLALRR